MAYRPCVSCGRPFYGASEFTYVTWFSGEDRYSFRMLQCHGCASDLRNDISSVGDVRRDGVWELSPEAPVQLREAAS